MRLTHIPIVISLTNKRLSFSIKQTTDIEQNSNLMMTEYIKDYGEVDNIMYFHNMANFDGYFILKSLIDNNIQPKVINRFNKILSIEFTINYKIIDSYLIIPYSLKKACEIYNKILQKKDFNFKQINKYCQNYSDALYELITEYNSLLIKEFGLPIYSSITMSSYSYHLFFKKYYE